MYQPVLKYHKNMRSLQIHTNLYKKNFTSFFIRYKKGKILSLPTKEIKANFDTDDLIFRKKFNLSSGTLLSLSSYIDNERGSAEYNSAESLH